jgi:hypothetical protein
MDESRHLPLAQIVGIRLHLAGGQGKRHFHRAKTHFGPQKMRLVAIPSRLAWALDKVSTSKLT